MAAALISIEPINRQITHLRRNLRELAINAETNTYYMNQYTTAIKNNREKYFALKRTLLARWKLRALNADLYDASFDPSTYNIRDTLYRPRLLVNRARSDAKSCAARELQLTEHIERKKQEIEAYDASLPPPVTFNRNAVKATVLALPHVTAAGIAARGNLVSLTVNYEGIKMAPIPEHRDIAAYVDYKLKQEFPDLVRDPFSTPIADCTIKFSFNRTNGHCSISGKESNPAPLTGERSIGFPFHPHWLYHDGPCLGDFAGALTEAQTNFDYVTLVSLMQIYLSSYNLLDGAGYRATVYGLTPEQARNTQIRRTELALLRNRAVYDQEYLNTIDPQLVAAPNIDAMDETEDQRTHRITLLATIKTHFGAN